MQEIPADLFLGMFGKPLTHHVVCPVPLKRVSIEAVILRPRGSDVIQELFPATPRGAFQVSMAEGADEQFRLVQPRGVDRCKAGPPPTSAIGPVGCRIGRRVARVAVLDQKGPAQTTMPAVKSAQGPNVPLRIFLGLDGQFHPPSMDDQKQQQVDGAVPDVLELLMFDAARPRTSDRAPLQNLQVGHFIDANDPEPARGQMLGISVAPQHPLGPFLELRVEATRLPVPGAVRLQVDAVQDLSYRTRADGLDDTIADGLSGQVGAAPVRDVQPFGDRLQTSQLHDLSTLQGGKLLWATRPPGLPQHDIEAVLFVTTANSPDRGRVALQFAGQCLDPLPGGDTQEDSGMLDLEPRLRAAPSKPLEDGDIIEIELQRARSSTTHGQPPAPG